MSMAFRLCVFSRESGGMNELVIISDGGTLVDVPSSFQLVRRIYHNLGFCMPVNKCQL